MNGVKKLIMLGTGNAMVTKVFNTCFLIELPDGELFMTDAAGRGGLQAAPSHVCDSRPYGPHPGGNLDD